MCVYVTAVSCSCSRLGFTGGLQLIVYAGVVIVFECAALQLQLHAQHMACPGVLSEGLPQTEVYNSIVALLTAALWFCCILFAGWL